MSDIINRVAQSPIITIDLEEIYPREERVIFDLKSFLFQELILKEKEFRASLKSIDWNEFKNKWVSITCTADAIIPNWAFILVATCLHPLAKGYVIGDLSVLEISIADRCVSEMDSNTFLDRPVVIKGCSKINIPLYAYGRIIQVVQDKARTIMYGEPCSTVPLFKKGKN